VEPADPAALFAQDRAGLSQRLARAGERRSLFRAARHAQSALARAPARPSPAAFVGTKDDSWALRWELVPIGLVAIAYPQGESPSVIEQAARTLDLLPLLSLADYFRRYDPTAFEATERTRLSAVAARAALLLCQPGTERLGSPGDTSIRIAGRAALRAFADRFETLNPTPDAECLRALGFYRAFAADARDPARARTDLERYLATGASGADADEARSLLAQLDASPH
jgi:hypothetical protein